jgi:hypothetical protein
MAIRRKKSSSVLNKLKEGNYDFTRLTYPSLNLGTDALPNYIIFYINLPETAGYDVSKVKFNGEASSSDRNSGLTRGTDKVFYGDALATGGLAAGLNVAGDLSAKFGSGSGPDLSNVGESLGGTAAAATIQAGTGIAIAKLSQNIKKKPKYNRIQSAIALYMPDTVFQTYSHDYDALSVTDATGLLGMGQRAAGAFNLPKEFSIDAIENAIAGVGQSPGGREAAGYIAERSGLVNQGFTDLLLRDQGKALNPQIEMVYKRTQNRSFIFDFRMQPRSNQESVNIKNIIKQFKRFAAPSLTDSTGAYFNIPGQFDVEFMFKDSENKFIGKISTCVLENIDVNYSSAGPFATFDDGAPVEIYLQLRFREVDTLTRELFEEGADDEATF